MIFVAALVLGLLALHSVAGLGNHTATITDNTSAPATEAQPWASPPPSDGTVLAGTALPTPTQPTTGAIKPGDRGSRSNDIPRASGGANQIGSDNSEPANQLNTDAEHHPPAPASSPNAPDQDLGKYLAAATAAVTAVPRTIDGMDVDDYVEKFDTPTGSQIRRIEGDVEGALSDISTPSENPEDSIGHPRDVGMIRGAYHFALPDRASGSAQATYFATNGGGWSRDGRTLPGALDLEWNPYGPACYGKSKAGMRAWIRALHDTYRAHTGRWPVIYTSTSWWNHCVGSGHGFDKTVPLWIARYSNDVGPLPPGWNDYTFWQYTNDPIDKNKFNGSKAQLRELAGG